MMETRTFFRADGIVRLVMTGLPEQLAHNEVEGELSFAGDFSGHYLQDGVPVKIPEAPSSAHYFDLETKEWKLSAKQAALQCRLERAAEYPALGDQLDALWHAMDAGLLPQIPGFYDQIKAVKDQFPKPQQEQTP